MFCTAPEVFLPKLVKNKTKCSPFSSEKKCSTYFCTVLYCARSFLDQNCKKQNEMLAFFTPKNSGRLLCFVVLRHRFSRQTCLQNKTKCLTVLLKNLKCYAFSHFLSFGGYPLKTRYILKGWRRCLNLLLHVLQTPPTSIWGVSVRPCWHFFGTQNIVVFWALVFSRFFVILVSPGLPK